MTAFDVAARATAARLLAPIVKGGKGQAIDLIRQPSGAYDPATSGAAVASTTDKCWGAVFEYTTYLRSGLRNEPGAAIQAGDRQLLLSALDANGAAIASPLAGDWVKLASGARYVVVGVAPLAPAGTPILYECNIRGAEG